MAQQDLIIGEWRGGWRAVVGSGIGLGVGYGLYLVVSSLFIKPMAEDFGWPRSQLTFTPLVGIIGSFMYPLAGMVADRIGYRRTAMGGLLASGLCYLAFACLPQSRMAWVAGAVVLGLVAPFTGYVVFLSAVVRSFRRWRGTALAVTMCGISAIAAIVLPVLQHIIAVAGWRSGYVLLAGLSLVVGLAAVTVLLREAPSRPKAEDGAPQAVETGPSLSLKEIFATSDFRLLTVAFVAAAIPTGGFLAHIQPLLTDAGIPAATAALVGSVFAISMVVGRLGAGMMLDRFRPHLVAAVLLSIPCVGAVILAQIANLTAVLPAAIFAVALLGLAQGAEADLMAFFVSRHFGLRHYSIVFGIMIGGVGLGMSAGGMGFAWLFDRHGDYVLASLISGAIFLVAGASIFLCRHGRRADALSAATPQIEAAPLPSARPLR